MLAYLLRRAAWGIVLLLALTLVTYIIFFVVPSDPPIREGRAPATDLSRSFGLHGSVFQQYGEFVWNTGAHGSLGRSFRSRREVTVMIAEAAPVTASLIVGGVIFALLIGFVVGVVSALRPRSLVDRGAMVFVLLGISVHPVWIGLVLTYFFGFKWHVTPLGGYCELVSPSVGSRCGGPYEWAYHLLLPWLTFAILFSALYARMIRASVLEAYEEDYVRTARAKGAGRARILRVHVLRNALLPVLTMVGMDAGLAFAGALFIERVYGLPGMGMLVVRSLARRDLPPVVGVVLVVTLAIVVLNLLVDLLYAWIDPRVRIAATSR